MEIQRPSHQEINDRLKRRYLDRLVDRVKKLRKLLVERSWEDLRIECGQLASSGETFGFETLTFLATAAHKSIPEGKLARAYTPALARETTEALISAIDEILIGHHAKASESAHIGLDQNLIQS